MCMNLNATIELRKITQIQKIFSILIEKKSTDDMHPLPVDNLLFVHYYSCAHQLSMLYFARLELSFFVITFYVENIHFR